MTARSQLPTATRIAEAIQRVLYTPVTTADFITPFTALGADSLDHVELVMAFEDEFGIDVPEDRAGSLNSGLDMLVYLRSTGYPIVPLEVQEVAAKQPPATEQTATPAAAPAPLTLQQLFDRVVTALMAQGRQSIDVVNGGCMYRDPDGNKCAVGHLITDEVYASHTVAGTNDLEGNTVPGCSTVRRAVIESVGPVDQRGMDLLAWLQDAHDQTEQSTTENDPKGNRAWMDEFFTRASRVATVYNLRMSALVDAYSAAVSAREPVGA